MFLIRKIQLGFWIEFLWVYTPQALEISQSIWHLLLGRSMCPGCLEGQRCPLWAALVRSGIEFPGGRLHEVTAHSAWANGEVSSKLTRGIELRTQVLGPGPKF